MTQPRHLWSGDWRRESAETAERFARRRESPAEPIEAPPVQVPPRVSLLDRMRAALGRLRGAVSRLRAALGQIDTSRLPRNVLLAIAMLLTAAVAYAAVSALRTSGTHSPARPSSALSSGPAWLGIDTANFPLTSGAMIVDVVPSSPADLAGLEPGEVITAIGNRPVQGSSDVQSALAGLHAGQRVQVTYQQGPTTYTTEVTLQGRHSGP